MSADKRSDRLNQMLYARYKRDMEVRAVSVILSLVRTQEPKVKVSVVIVVVGGKVVGIGSSNKKEYAHQRIKATSVTIRFGHQS